MARSLLVALCVLALSHWSLGVQAAGNKYPIVLVHGFSGWGRTELGGSKNIYWGGFHGDWQEDLKKQGYDVRTAVVGPFASNWDRACELFAYIKGGTVFYGTNHSRTHGHNATGRTYPGLFPQWGEVVDGEVQKIHLIGHSMGGQTIRMLAQLLAEGTKGAPIEEDPNSHPLFTGGKDWIHSITGVAASFQGTIIADGFKALDDKPENLMGALLGFLDSFGSGFSKVYDAKLDQWGISARKPDEKIKDYVKRIFASPMLAKAGKDLCVYSLSMVGAKEEISWVKVQPNVFYYSITNQDTFRLGNIVVPNPISMLLPLQPLSLILGSNILTKKGYSADWQINDGVVSLPAMTSDGVAPVVEGVNASVTGRWHHAGHFKGLDHEGMVGVKPSVSAFPIYVAHAKMLYELPATQAATERRRLRTEPTEFVHSSEVSKGLSDAFEAVNAKTAAAEKAAIVAACAKPASEEIRKACKEHFRA